MSTPPNVRDLLDKHVVLQLESLDRLYLNGYVAHLQHGAGLVRFLSEHRGQPIASPALLGHITSKFVAQVKGDCALWVIHHGPGELKSSPQKSWKKTCPHGLRLMRTAAVR